MNILLLLVIATFLISQPILSLAIRFAYRFNLLDHPCPRRRHRKPTPIVGGLSIFLTWALAIGAYSFFKPDWIHANFISLVPMSVGLAILLLVGVVDDVKGLSPKPKFFFQLLATLVMMIFDPRLHSLVLYWEAIIGIVIWPLTAIWIVGITNAVNLIDGLDGLAGGTSFLVSCSIATLSFVSDGVGALQGVAMILLAASILGFLRFNWSPAKMFLGDNGSLPLGFMIAVNSLTCHPTTRSWIMIASVILMMGYPILDMGLAVLRRHREGLELFKADRNHLHFRVQRLGLTVGQTALFLLSVSLYLQVTALSLNLLPTEAVLPSLALVVFSVFGLLYVVRCIERARIHRISKSRMADTAMMRSDFTNVSRLKVDIPLSPIFEVGMFEERARCQEIVLSLEMMLKATAAKDEEVTVTRDRIQILCSSADQNSIRKRYDAKLQSFCSLMELQCSTSKIPFKIKNAA